MIRAAGRTSSRAERPRPLSYWRIDVFKIAERLLLARSGA
jgi:hypothetical protein